MKIVLFENIGGKIKLLARIFFFIEVAASIIISIVLTVIFESPIFLLFIFVGVFSWISACLLYCFGEIADKLSEIAENTRNLKRNLKTKPKTDDDRLSEIAENTRNSERNLKIKPKTDDDRLREEIEKNNCNESLTVQDRLKEIEELRAKDLMTEKEYYERRAALINELQI